jgi:hypothetical protein
VVGTTTGTAVVVVTGAGDAVVGVAVVAVVAPEEDPPVVLRVTVVAEGVPLGDDPPEVGVVVEAPTELANLAEIAEIAAVSDDAVELVFCAVELSADTIRRSFARVALRRARVLAFRVFWRDT